MSKRPWKKIWSYTIVTFVVLFLFFSGFAVWWVDEIKDSVPAWKPEDLETDINTYIYDGDGNILSVLHAEKNRVPISIDEISPYLVQAFIATEDERFYEHNGIDFKAIARAAVVNFNQRGPVEGGSTITQQLVKNAFLSPQKTLQRKIKEALLAIELEKRFSKEEILELYLNRIYFGHGAYGVESAAQTYFGKSASDLTLSETALLAGIPKNPRKYSPYYNLEAAQNRQAVVLTKMNQLGFIEAGQYDSAKSAELQLKGLSTKSQDRYPFFLDAAIEETLKQCKISEEELFRGGLRIYTTVDPKVQAAAEQVFADSKNFPRDYGDQQVEGAVAVMDYRTGYVKALVGGRQHLAKRGFNRATQLQRQPGSTFKPIAVYGPALEKKYPPNTVIDDSPVSFGKYSPKNAGGGYSGPMYMRDALRRSVNVVAVKLLDMIGIDAGFNFAKKLGFDLENSDRGLALALGGITKGVAPLDMAGAFGAFANNGSYIQPFTVKKITNFKDEIIYENPALGQQVMSPQTAYLMTDMLQGVVRGGTGTRARLNRPVAGKTGTTQLPKTREFSGLSGNKDAWFVGYTPELVAAVWIGYDQTDRKNYLRIYGGTYPAMIWRQVMQLALQDEPVKKFPSYQGRLVFRKDVKTFIPPPEPVPVPGANPAVPGTPGTNPPVAANIITPEHSAEEKPSKPPKPIKPGKGHEKW